MAVRKGIETPRARQAFEDYYNLGTRRSFKRLAEEYRRRTDGGQDVPTIQSRQLEKWSAQYAWQERIAKLVAEEEAEQRRETWERTRFMRRKAMAAIDIDVDAFLQMVKDRRAAGQEGPILIEDPAGLEKLIKFYLQLGEDPIGEKQTVEHTGANGGPVQFQIVQFGEEDHGGGNREPADTE
jgi:hypothetical protein